MTATTNKRRRAATVLSVLLAATGAFGQPKTGMPVAELWDIEQAMHNYMVARDISGGLLGIMKDGEIVYQRGFGWKDEDRTVPLRHDAVMRLASLTKPITAAGVQRLFESGQLDPNAYAFDLGQPEGGVLLEWNYPPFPSLHDPRYVDVRVKHIYTHTAGMPTNNEHDPMFKEREIAEEFDDAGEPTDSPPGRAKTLRWVLGHNLHFDPGSGYIYSNVGFLTLSLITETVTGQWHTDFVRDAVFGPIAWAPGSELVAGRTFKADQDPREPWYDSNGERCWDVIGFPNRVDCAYGNWHHEQHTGGGGMVASTTLMLHLAYNYYCSHLSTDPNGVAINGDLTYGDLTYGQPYHRSHNGSLRGTSTFIGSRDDGVIVCVLFNKRNPSGAGPHYGQQAAGVIYDLIDDMADAGVSWPTRGVDGQWVDFSSPGAGNGSYEDSWNDFATALADSPDKATLNFRSGTQLWTGTINQRVRLRAPQPGVSAVIGINN